MPLQIAYPTMAPMESSPAAAISIEGMTANMLLPLVRTVVYRQCRPLTELCFAKACLSHLILYLAIRSSAGHKIKTQDKISSKIGLTLGFTIATALQLQHAGDQHCRGNGRLNEACRKGKRYWHAEQPVHATSCSKHRYKLCYLVCVYARKLNAH